MLLLTSRHTAHDLRLWSELEEADRVHAKLRAFELRVAQAQDVVRSFLSEGLCYLGVSWGKDSVTCAHLLWSVCGDQVPLVHIVQVPGENPYCAEVRDLFLSRFPMKYTEVVADYRGIDGSEDEIDARTDRVFARCFREVGVSRYFSGIRAEESSGRRQRFRRHGLTSVNTCAPLGWWRSQDVFAYLATHDLPAHPNYGMLGGGRWDRQWLRVCRVGGMPGRAMGREAWEREYYGDLMRRRDVGG